MASYTYNPEIIQQVNERVPKSRVHVQNEINVIEARDGASLATRLHHKSLCAFQFLLVCLTHTFVPRAHAAIPLGMPNDDICNLLVCLVWAVYMRIVHWVSPERVLTRTCVTAFSDTTSFGKLESR